MVICSVRLLHKCNNEVEFPEKIKFHTRKELNAALSSLRREGKPSKEVKLFRKEAQKTRRCVSCNLAKEKYEENCRIFEESRRNLKHRRKQKEELEKSLQQNFTQMKEILSNHNDRIKQLEDEQTKEERRKLRREKFFYLNKEK